MSKRLQWQRFLLFVLLAWGDINGQQVFGQQIQAYPDYGDKVSYFDVDAQGQILEIDYASQTANILGKIDFDSKNPLLFVRGWVLNHGQYGIFILSEFETSKRHFGRIYIYTAGNPILQATALVVNLGSEAFGVIPISKETIYIRYADMQSDEVKGVVFDLSRNAIRGTFNFPVNGYVTHSLSADEKNLFLFGWLDSWIKNVDIRSNKVVKSWDARDIIGISNKRELVFVDVLGKKYVLVTTKNRDNNKVKIFLIGLLNMKVVAESDSLPFFTGKYYINEDDDGGTHVFCVEDTAASGRYKPTGRIKRFVQKGKKLVLMDGISFNPETEVALQGNDGNFKVFPKYFFDYLSVLTIRDRITSDDQYIGYAPEYFPRVAEAVSALAKQYNATSFREKGAVVKHLKINLKGSN